MDKRIITLMEVLGLTPSEFADSIEVQRSGISHITSGRNKPSLDFLERTLTKFPEINVEWLILGKGKPMKEYNNIQKNDITDTIQQPTLFSFDESIKNKEKNIVVEDKFIEENISAENIEENKNTDSNLLDKQKNINKIIIFYSDGSFELYENK